MTPRRQRAPSRAELDGALVDLGVPATKESRALLRKLTTDSSALHRTVRRLASSIRPDVSTLPDVDGLVTAAMRRNYNRCIDPTLLRTRRSMGSQNKLLLAFLLERMGQEVSLLELLVVNGLHNATSRRLRELETEHGHFPLRVVGTGEATAYVLDGAEPDIDATAYYWLKRNIRDRTKGSITPHARLLALLSARLKLWPTLRSNDLAQPHGIAGLRPYRAFAGRRECRLSTKAAAQRCLAAREGTRVSTGLASVSGFTASTSINGGFSAGGCPAGVVARGCRRASRSSGGVSSHARG